MGQNAAAHQEHGQGAHNRQAPHQPRHGAQQPFAQRAGRAAFTKQHHAQIIELDDACHQAIHAQRHAQRNHRKHQHALQQRRIDRQGAQGNHHNLGRQNKVGAHRPLDLVFFHLQQRFWRHGDSLGLLGIRRIFMFAVQQFVQHFFHALVAQKEAARHQQRRNQRRGKSTDEQSQRYQNQFIDQRPFEDRPHHRQLAIGFHARNLLRIECQIISQHAGGFFNRHLAHHGHIVKDGGDVIKQCKQTGSHGKDTLCRKKRIVCRSKEKLPLPTCCRGMRPPIQAAACGATSSKACAKHRSCQVWRLAAGVRSR